MLANKLLLQPNVYCLFTTTTKCLLLGYYFTKCCAPWLACVPVPHCPVCVTGSRVRLATLEMSLILLKSLVYHEGQCFLQDRHLAATEGAREEATLQLRNFYKVWEKVGIGVCLLVCLGGGGRVCHHFVCICQCHIE